MRYVINATFRSARRALRIVDVRGDGKTVERERLMTFADREAAERYAAHMREQFPDTTYEVAKEPIG